MKNVKQCNEKQPFSCYGVNVFQQENPTCLAAKATPKLHIMTTQKVEAFSNLKMKTFIIAMYV